MTNVRIAYTSITPAPFSRAKVHIEALRAAGVPVLEVFNAAPGIRKYLSIISVLSRNKNAYDCIVVGFPGYALVPFIRVFFSAPVIFDAGWPLYDGEVTSRKKSAAARVWLTDKLAFSCADSVWLESDAQVEHCARFFRVPKEKMRRVFTGADERVFYEEEVPKASVFTAVFRGKYLPEAGVEVVVDAARMLPTINFLILSPGYEPAHPLPANVTLDTVFHEDPSAIRRRMHACHVSIGQVSAHDRLSRTIPHKAFETLAMGLPYVSSAVAPLRELAGEEGALYVVPGSAESLAHALRSMESDPACARAYAETARAAYAARASWPQLAEVMRQDAMHAVRRFEGRRFRIVRFFISGVTASLANLGLVYVATEVFGLWYLLSSVLGFCAGVCTSFVLQRWWTFKNKSRAVVAQFTQYVLAAILGLVFNTSVVYGAVHFFGAHYLVAQILAGVLVASCNFVLYSWYIFRTDRHVLR